MKPILFRKLNFNLIHFYSYENFTMEKRKTCLVHLRFCLGILTTTPVDFHLHPRTAGSCVWAHRRTTGRQVRDVSRNWTNRSFGSFAKPPPHIVVVQSQSLAASTLVRPPCCRPLPSFCRRFLDPSDLWILI